MNDEKITLDLVIDVQKDFITGALANTQAQANVTHLAETARAHAQAGHWMFFTRDTHQDNYLTTREGRRLPIEHCIEGEDGWNFAPELENVMADTEPEVCHIVDKPTFGSYMLPRGNAPEPPDRAGCHAGLPVYNHIIGDEIKNTVQLF